MEDAGNSLDIGNKITATKSLAQPAGLLQKLSLQPTPGSKNLVLKKTRRKGRDVRCNSAVIAIHNYDPFVIGVLNI